MLLKLSQLSPQPLWDIFAKICSIPHPSYHEEHLAKYIMNWAQERGLHTKRDRIGNVLIRKKATAGMENRKTVTIQAHLDMVPQKNEVTTHNFIKDPIRPYISGEWVKAYDTTLGADNGIGIASALAVLDDNSYVKHGPLEVLLTMTEEVGMNGAANLQTNWLRSEILINTDSEEEGKICIGCAGGIHFISTLKLSRETLPANFQFFKLTIKGLKGGHSGSDIHLGRGNANKLLARFFAEFALKINLRLVDFQGGTISNAIPREAYAIIAIPKDKTNILRNLVTDYLIILKNELSEKERKLDLVLKITSSDKIALTNQSYNNFIQLLNAIPNSVIRNSDVGNGSVETSLNVGIVTMSFNTVKIVCLIRSLVDSSKFYVVSMLESLTKLAGAQSYTTKEYPGWQPNTDSPLIKLLCKIYQRLFNKMPVIQVIHAGLECGLFKKSYPKMDIISIGPTIINPHSPDEQLNIKSVSHYWLLLTELLKSIPPK